VSAGAEVPGPAIPSSLGPSEVDVPEGFPEAVVDLSVIKETVHRRRRLWVGAAIAGMVLGAALQFVVPSKYVAVSDLLMSEPANADPVQAIADDVSLLQTRVVAQRAVNALHLRVNATEFLTTYSATAVSDTILSIRVSAPTSADAVAYNNAISKAFLAERVTQTTYQTKLLTTDIDAQVDALNADISALTTSINALSGGAPGPQTTNQLTELVDQRSSDDSQVASLQADINQDLINENSVNWGTYVLDTATPVKASVKKAIVEDALSGFVAGLGLSLGALIVLAIISDRPRRRADIAAVLGAPVELSVGRYRRARALRNRRIRRRMINPQAQLRLIENRLRAHLLAVRGTALAVVALEAPEIAAVSLGALAFSLASEGVKVVLVDMAEGRPLASSLGATRDVGVPHKVSLGGNSVTLITAPSDLTLMGATDVPTDADAILVLATVAPAMGADHLAPWVNGAVVMLTTGEVSATRIASCGQMLRQATVPVRAGILVGADREDETVGIGSAELLLPQRPTHGRKIEDDLAALSRNGLRENGDRASGEVKANQP
jgi:capsular polysaccharide biosynthesis protein